MIFSKLDFFLKIHNLKQSSGHARVLFRNLVQLIVEKTLRSEVKVVSKGKYTIISTHKMYSTPIGYCIFSDIVQNVPLTVILFGDFY